MIPPSTSAMRYAPQLEFDIGVLISTTAMVRETMDTTYIVAQTGYSPASLLCPELY